MFVTVETLKKLNACDQGLKYIERFYANGANIIDLINDRHIPKDFLHWGREHLTLTDEEFKAYCRVCNIENTESFWYSCDIKNSKNIVKSKLVDSSTGVFQSTEVVNGIDVVNCEQIEDCAQIFSSNWVARSSKVFSSSNVEESENICDSSSVIRSKNIVYSKDVLNSSEIMSSNNITNSASCFGAKSLKNCLFCCDISDKECHLFNKPVEKERFEVYKRQYEKIMEHERLALVKDWPERLSASEVPILDLNMSHYYDQVHDTFWKWARTLPNFDEQIFYNITMNKKALML